MRDFPRVAAAVNPGWMTYPCWGWHSALRTQNFPLEPVARTAGGTTHSTLLRYIQPDTALTHPPNYPAGIPNHQCIVRYVTGDNSSGTDKRVPPYRVPANNRGIRANRRAFLYQRSLVFILARNMTPRIDHIGEHHRRSAKHIIFQHDPGVHRYVVLNFDVVSNSNLRRNHYVLADVASFANP